jgi:arabinose-5-phosphate isomerase
MSMDAALSSAEADSSDQLRFARQVILLESDVLAEVAQRLDQRFCRAAQYIYNCRGSVIVSGIGKAGLIGQKIMATLASTGTRSHCLHPAEAVHGDLGRIHPLDVVLVLSQSGETEEIVRLLPSLAEIGVPILAMTGRADSALGRAATVTIELGQIQEACSLGLAPSTSTTAMLAVGDALALVVSKMRHFRREDFARFHPAGSLGRKLSRVDHHLRPLAECRVANDSQTIREVFVGLSTPGRRTGAIMLVDAEGRLSGIFTDSDLARLFERHRDRELDAPIRNVMTARPVVVSLGAMMSEAVAIMAGRKISELPVVDTEGRPVGLIDITDVVGMLPKKLQEEETEQEAAPVAESGRPPRYRLFPEPEEGREA